MDNGDRNFVDALYVLNSDLVHWISDDDPSLRDAKAHGFVAEAECLWVMGKTNEALSAAQSINTASMNDEEKRAIAWIRGLTLYSTAQFSAAADQFQIVANYPEFKYGENASCLLAVSLARSQKLDEANIAFDEWVRRYHPNVKNACKYWIKWEWRMSSIRQERSVRRKDSLILRRMRTRPSPSAPDNTSAKALISQIALRWQNCRDLQPLFRSNLPQADRSSVWRRSFGSNLTGSCRISWRRWILVTQTDGAVHVIDFKTSRSRWTQQKAQESAEQLLLYGVTVKQITRPLAAAVKLHFAIITQAKKPVVQLIPVIADETGIAGLKESVGQIWQAIRAGNFYPSPSPQNCSTCPFKSRCPVFGGK